MQKIAKICKKICIYKKNIVSLQRISKVVEIKPQKVTNKNCKNEQDLQHSSIRTG